MRIRNHLLCALAVAGTLLGGGLVQAEDVRVSEGQELFMRYCASCHGMNAKGDGPASEAMVPPPTNLTTLAQRWGKPLTKSSLAEFIDGRRDVRAHGTSEMPVWGTRLTDPVPPSTAGGEPAAENIALLLDYLETLQVETKK